ncbi:MAG: ATP-binding protein [Methanomassiliicoccaceae archaeon]|nr:ATP-binding protein [Methanomassiliicoccaceae archaeon]
MPSENDLVKRERYLSVLRPFKGNGNAKVVTGMRRCGKSSLLETFANSLRGDTNVISISMEHSENAEKRPWRWLLDAVNDRLDPTKENVLIIDEVQGVAEWELAVRDLIAKRKCDIYLTGSNSDLLSSEYSTYLGGRYNDVRMLPLAFSECVEFHERYHGPADPDDLLQRFVLVGGFPILWRFNHDVDSSIRTVRTLVDSSVNNDILNRYGVKNVEILMRILRTVASTIGSYVSAINIFNTLRSAGVPVSKDTVYDYLGHLEAANIIIKTEASDVRGRGVLRSTYKYYLADLAIKHALTGYRPEDAPGHMENIILTELLGRGYDVHVGRVGDKEVDFVADKWNERVYVQACKEIASGGTFKREFGNLESINDSHPKYVVMMNAGMYRGVTSKGIICCSLREFLEMENYSMVF